MAELLVECLSLQSDWYTMTDLCTLRLVNQTLKVYAESDQAWDPLLQRDKVSNLNIPYNQMTRYLTHHLILTWARLVTQKLLFQNYFSTGMSLTCPLCYLQKATLARLRIMNINGTSKLCEDHQKLCYEPIDQGLLHYGPQVNHYQVGLMVDRWLAVFHLWTEDQRAQIYVTSWLPQIPILLQQRAQPNQSPNSRLMG